LEALCRVLRCQPGDLLEFVPGRGASAAGEKREI
jgi:DNA-binding Xre family transcriptional regulator